MSKHAIVDDEGQVRILTGVRCSQLECAQHGCVFPECSEFGETFPSLEKAKQKYPELEIV